MCSGGNVELREGLLDLFELDVAALGDLPGAVERVFHLAEQLHHLGARLQVEVRRGPSFMRAGVGHGLAGLDAEQDFVRARVFPAQVVRVVGGDQRDARSPARAG